MALALEHDEQPGLTEEEQAILESFRGVWEALDVLPRLHQADRNEAAFHLNALARIVGMRAAHRAYPHLVPAGPAMPSL
jgi:hypothetical protein